MKTNQGMRSEVRKSYSFYVVLLVMLAGMLLSSCQETDPLSPGQTAVRGTLSTGGTTANMEPGPTAIYKTAIVNPSSGANLKIKGQNINDGEFHVKPGNVPEATEMTLVKLSEISNVYHLLPFGMDLPEGVVITLMYDHSAMPFGVTEDDLQVFRLTPTDTIALDSQVKPQQLEVKASSNATGEYALGAYDVSGRLHLLEGEYGVRQEETFNPRKEGILRLGGGSELCVPKNALDERTTIAVIASRETIRGKSNSKSFTFTPHGTEFNIPIELVLSWRELAGQTVVLYYFNEYTQEWEVNAEGVWDENNNTVTLLLHHFSRYALAHG